MSLHYTGFSRSEGRIARLECDTCGNGATCTDVSPAWGMHECQECFNQVCSNCKPARDCDCETIVCPKCVGKIEGLTLCKSCCEDALLETIQTIPPAIPAQMEGSQDAMWTAPSDRDYLVRREDEPDVEEADLEAA